MDYDGASDRQAIFARLHSFDHYGLADTAFASQAMALIDLPDATTAEAVLVHHIAVFREVVFPDSLVGKSTTSAADAVLENTFSFYGETHALGADIDWEHNPGTAHWGHDLNRFSYLNPLAQAWAATGDRRYAEKAVALVLDWIAKTDVCDAFVRTSPGGGRPDKSAHVWSSYLNIAIHIDQWGRLFQLIAHAPDLVTPLQWLRILKSVHDQLWYLDLVIPEAQGNWVTIGTRGQLATLSRLPGLRDTTALATTAFSRLTAATADQLLPDGAQYELTPHYHMVVIRNLDTALDAARRLPVPPPPGLQELFDKAVRYMHHLVTPDGLLVAFNDSDPDAGPGILRQLSTPRLQAALGADAAEERTSSFFRDAGVMILRQGSRHGAEELYLAFDGGPFGASHQHEDALGFWLSAYGRSFVVDPGRHLYDGSSVSFRPYLSGTSAHSTITIDNAPQQSRAARESWLDPAPQQARFAVADDGTVTATATYAHGYAGVSDAVTHTRTFTFFPTPGYWQCVDQINGAGEHVVTSRLQFMPGTLKLGDGLAHTCYGDADLAVFFAPAQWDAVTVRTGEQEPRQGWYSAGYNQIEPAPMLVFERRTALPFTARLVLVPYRDGQVPERP
jgi:hypothetical protein